MAGPRALILPAVVAAALCLVPAAPSAAVPAAGDDCDATADSTGLDRYGNGMACEPFLDNGHRWRDTGGTRSGRIVQPGDPCPGPNSDMATGPQGQKMICVGDSSNATWKAM
ncbi:hypothetical protein [Nocardia sp. alder85J]|uniref:hypothetical protein n=1 Tax=Nocardia sp. alder85J TaxID=2862949 RepID=UPI001CD64E97|nr:hypothetical protein [Nocardia sp. alder85J]MCX4098558.1 hypothetical protein [Nocardia sp. alder85J]